MTMKMRLEMKNISLRYDINKIVSRYDGYELSNI